MISWSDVESWNPAPLSEAAQTCGHRNTQLGDVAKDIDAQYRALTSKGETADAARRALNDHEDTAESLQQMLKGFTDALSQASASVASIQTQVGSCRTFATTTGMIIQPSGTVEIGPTVYAAAYAQQASMRVPSHTMTPAWHKGVADQNTLVGMMRGVMTLAGETDSALASGLASAAGIPVGFAAEGGGDAHTPQIQLMANTVDLSDDLGDSGTADKGKAPSLPLNEDDYWKPPKHDSEVKLDKPLDKDETFPPDGMKLEPNTRYEVSQGGGKSNEMDRGFYYTDENGVVTHVDSNVSREKGGPLNYDLRRPAADTRYRVDNVTYMTDNQGRVDVAVIDNIDFSEDGKGARHESIQGSVGREADVVKNGEKVLDFDGGHINAAQSGGIREEINYTPQNVDVNQSRKGKENYYALEQLWKKEWQGGHPSDIVIRHVYDEVVQKEVGVNANVPTSYIIEYLVDDQKDPVEVVLNNVGQ